MFPAIRSAFRDLRQGFGSDLTRLDLKDCFQSDQFGFDTTVGLEQQKLNRLRGILNGYGPSWSGENVNDRSSLNHSVVWACRRIIAESVAFLPLSLMRQRGDVKEPATDHPVYGLLHDEPNPEMSDMEFRETLTDQVVAGGNAFSRIVRRSSDKTAIAFWPITNGSVTIDRNQARELVYVVRDRDDQERTYTVQANRPQDLLHVRGLGSDGIIGYSVITMARQSIGTGLSTEKYAAKFFAAGGRVPYTIELQNKFKTDQDFQKWRADWNTFYANSDNWHQAAMLEPGMVYKQIGLSPEDSQFLETRNFGVSELCRWFLISPDMVGDMSKATLNNMEQLALRFVKMTLTAWIVRWEKALRRCVLTPQEKADGYFFRHNVNALLRGDFASRMAGYASALQNGHLSINEVRDLEDRNGIDGGDDHHIQLNMQSLPGETPTASQAAALVRVGPPKGVAA